MAALKRQRSNRTVTNTRSSVEPFLMYSTERELRETVWRTFFKRGAAGSPDGGGLRGGRPPAREGKHPVGELVTQLVHDALTRPD